MCKNTIGIFFVVSFLVKTSFIASVYIFRKVIFIQYIMGYNGLEILKLYKKDSTVIKK